MKQYRRRIPQPDLTPAQIADFFDVDEAEVAPILAAVFNDGDAIQRRALWTLLKRSVDPGLPVPKYVPPYPRAPLSDALKARVLARDGLDCRYCGKRTKHMTRNFDHVIPVSKGGPNTYENLVVCCSRCNYDKGTQTVFAAGMALRFPEGFPEDVERAQRRLAEGNQP